MNNKTKQIMDYEQEFDQLFTDFDESKVKKDATYFKIKNDLELKEKRLKSKH